MKFVHVRNMLLILVLFFSPLAAAISNLEGYEFIECTFEPRERSSRKPSDGEFTLINEKEAKYQSFTHPHIPVEEGTSQNWSGYAAATSLTSPANNSVSAVYGSWIVPTLSSASHNTWCSLWVGIDGYSSNSVEQLGTEHDWVNGHQSNYAWFEMYPNASYQINGFPVNNNDLISASVVYTANGVFVLTIVNETHKVYTTIPTSYTTSISAQRSSAEWILEAPYSGGILPLSHFNTASFSNCFAVINNIFGPINDHFWKDDMLTMTTSGGAPKAVPTALYNSGENFSVVWHHE